MWHLARPLAENWMTSEVTFIAQAKQVVRDLSRLYHALPALLDRLDRPEEPPRTPSKLPWIIVAGLIAIAFYGHFGIV